MKVTANILKKGRKMKLSEHLSQQEVDCQCKNDTCVHTFITERNIEAFNLTRQHFGKPILVNSGFRCIIHNKKVGGVKYSDHTKGDALDLRPEDPRELTELFEIARNYYDLVIPYLEQGFIHCSKRA